jgi:hypothetical protein
MSHRLHDASEVPCPHKNPSTIFMTDTIQDPFFQEARLRRLSKKAIYGAQLTPKRHSWTETPTFPFLRYTVLRELHRCDDSPAPPPWFNMTGEINVLALREGGLAGGSREKI